MKNILQVPNERSLLKLIVFAMAAITNYFKFGGLKQDIVTILCFSGSKIWHELRWPKIKR